MPNPATTPSGQGRHGERGSVLIYIFIAIVVFAALSFAVSRGNREGVATVDRERADLAATQILDYTGMVRRAVQVMKVNGIKDTALCFDHSGWGFNDYDHAACATPANQVFNPAGGGASFQKPGEGVLDRAHQTRADWNRWHFTGANRVTGVGQDCTTNGDCNELLLVLPYVQQAVCAAINRRLQINDGSAIPEDDPDFDTATPFAGAFNAGQALNVAALNGKRSGCFQANTSPADGSFVFYAVLSAH